MKKLLILLSKIIVIFVFAIFAVTIANNLIENYKNTPTQDYSVKQVATGQTPVERSAEALVDANKIAAGKTAPAPALAPKPVSIDLSAGVYVVGQDVPPGKYDINVILGHGNFYGNPGIINEMMGTNQDYYIQTYKNATFKKENTIEISGTLVVNLTSK
ncbi:MAG: hypothetical protein JJE18_03400 [Eubacteriaceae bacterium]|nr:hypothetical protein [Eubacteriaceae bacterium]